MRVIKFILLGLAVLVSCGGCIKYVKPAEIEGVWKSVHEEWTITVGESVTSETYDYGGRAGEQSAYLRIANASFDILASSRSKTVRMDYSDRFSGEIKENTDYRPVTQITATIRKYKLTGSDGSIWRVKSVTDERLVMSYDSGELTVGDETVKRWCDYVFVRVN